MLANAHLGEPASVHHLMLDTVVVGRSAWPFSRPHAMSGLEPGIRMIVLKKSLFADD